MQSAEIREKFLKYFEERGHKRVKSSSLIPAADPTLLFTNAGMVQFKDCFLGQNDLGFTRATTSQKCVRAGGKHNDLENVGFTPRHHTFFEMLGNFSFGDYFKKDAIHFAWELLTKVYGIPQDKLRITVFENDDEALELWKKEGVRADWIYKLGEKDNFWAMGDTGPCGPCTEIHYDWGSSYGCGKPECNPGCPCGLRFLEIWNLVFMQFNRTQDGKLTPLPKPSVDTGAGLERMASVLQGTYINYDNDLFQTLIAAISKRVGHPYHANADTDVSLRVIADHLRSCTFLIADGVVPSNEGRGYVLRRILRRAIRHGKKLGQEKPFLYELVDAVTAQLGSQYPELKTQQNLVKTLMKEEEERFHETIHRGIGLLEDTITKAKKENRTVISGEVAFKLYDSFGFPYDLIEVIAKEQSMTVDEKGFQAGMEKQRSMSVWKGGTDNAVTESITKALEGKKYDPKFLGYESLANQSELVALFDSTGKEVKSLSGDGFAVFTATPFYAESGGQAGDQGTISKEGTEAKVLNTTKIAKVIVHHIQVTKGSFALGAGYSLTVDSNLRQMTAINHTATHMLHAALRKTLGDRVKQAGSLVNSERLRFDFTYPRGLKPEEIEAIEKMVNDEIAERKPVEVQEMGYDSAIQSGALAFFDEKYGDKVRVVRIGKESPFSVELCGGTHLKNIESIGTVKILSESSVASGVRRIEAITSQRVIHYLNERSTILKSLENKVGVPAEHVLEKVEQLSSQTKALQKEVDALKLKLAQGSVGSSKSESKLESFGAVQAAIQSVPGADAKVLRSLVDDLKNKHKEKTLILLTSPGEGKIAVCVGVTSDLVGKYDAGKIVKELAPIVGGSGGGRSDFAQAGGTEPGKLSLLEQHFRDWLTKNT